MEGGQRVQFDCGLGKFHWQKDYHMTCQWTKIRHTKAHPWHQYVVFWPVCCSSFLCVVSFFCMCVSSLVSPAYVATVYNILVCLHARKDPMARRKFVCSSLPNCKKRAPWPIESLFVRHCKHPNILRYKYFESILMVHKNFPKYHPPGMWLI